MRSSLRLLLHLSAPRQLLQRPVPSVRIVSAAATGDGSSAPSAARPERRTGRAAEEQMTAAMVAALTDPRVLASLRPGRAGEVALLRAEVAALQAAVRVRASPGVDLARQETAIPAAAERVDLSGRGATTREEGEGCQSKRQRLLFDLDVRDKGGYTLLHAASRQGSADLVAALLRAGADKDAKTHGGRTALHWASYSGHREVVAALLRAGAKVDVKDKGGWTALHIAGLFGHTEVVAALLRAGADTEVKANDGYTALHWASSGGHMEMVAALLRAGADKKARNNDGETPLALAKLKGNVELVALLEGWRSE